MSTGIPYLDEVWNVTTGCTPCSPGCEHCYAAAYARRDIGDFRPWVRSTFPPDHERPRQFSDVQCHPDRLDKTLRWRKPRRVGVSFMGDLFHKDVPDAFLLDVFRAMNRANHHTYLLLTKRPERMRSFIARLGQEDGVLFLDHLMGGMTPRLDHVWAGVTVCNANELVKIEHLRDTPAAHRWVSFEPLLSDIGPVNLDGIEWVVVGCESGPKARPMHPEWARSLRDQAKAWRAKFYMKQMQAGMPYAFKLRLLTNPEDFPADLRVRELPWQHPEEVRDV